jgi:hypothetical protein
MNLELFTRLLEHEAKGLYLQNSTPETFMVKVKSLMRTLKNGEKCELVSDNELVEIIVASEHQKGQETEKINSFFDIVDLCLYRAN